MSDVTIDKISWLELFGKKHIATTLILASWVTLHATNALITPTLLPLIVSDIGGIEFYAWNTSLYILASILSAAIAANILRRIGAIQSFMLAGSVYFIGCMIAANADNMATLLLGRFTQGAGGGMISTLGYAIIIFVYPKRLWPLAFASLAGVWGIATLFGPALGGIFAELGQWRLSFLTLGFLSLVYAILSFVVLPRNVKLEDERKVAFIPLILLGTIIISFSVSNVIEDVWVKLFAIGLGLCFFYILVKRERMSDNRLFPKGSFDYHSPLFMSLLVMFTLIFVMNVDFFVPFYLQKLHGISPLFAGYIAAMVAVGWTGGELFFAKFTGSARLKLVQLAPILMPVSIFILAICLPLYEYSNLLILTLISLALMMIGVAIGSVWPHLASFALEFTPENEKAGSASTLSILQMFATAFGAAISGLIANASGFKQVEQVNQIANSATFLFFTFAMFALVAVFGSYKLVQFIAQKNEQ